MAITAGPVRLGCGAPQARRITAKGKDSPVIMPIPVLRFIKPSIAAARLSPGFLLLLYKNFIINKESGKRLHKAQAQRPDAAF
ncbi:hypothetical protein DPQ22_09545 [Candidatus Tokpelaia sp.]|nr:hypothetical protein DPQ22_09545 [Candidatus Tokpelaia sp.]